MWHRWLVAAIAVLLAGSALSCRQPLEVTGTATYLVRMVLPPSAVLEVQLADVSRANAPPVILAKESYTSLVGPPYRFALRPDTRQLDPQGTYVVLARILVDGKLRMVNTRRAKVDNSDPTKPVEVRLDPVPATVGE